MGHGQICNSPLHLRQCWSIAASHLDSMPYYYSAIAGKTYHIQYLMHNYSALLARYVRRP